MMNSGSTPVRVLIVEDEAIIASDLKLMVRRLGYVPEAIAATGEDAIEHARRLKPDVIIMDVRLAGPMSGLDAARLIREEQNPAVVYVTAFSRIAAADLGPGDRCLGKPFTRGDLRNAIEGALAEVRSPDRDGNPERAAS